MAKLNRRKFCECNCGTRISLTATWATGHHRTGVHLGKETIVKMRKPHGPQSEEHRRKNIEWHNKPEAKEESIKKAKERWQNPIYKETQRIAREKPGAKEKRIKAITIAKNTPGAKERQSIASIISNAKPGMTGKRLKSLAITNAKPEVKERKSQSIKKSWLDPIIKFKRIAGLKISQNKPEVIVRRLKSLAITNASPEVKERRSKSGKRYWESLHGEERFKRLEKWLMGMKVKPTKPEIFLLSLLDELFPGEWKYTGDFNFWINGKNPDFVNCNSQKKCIEFNGYYYHQNDIPGEREKIFAEFGYDTLILRDEDLLDESLLKSKLIEFHIKVNPYSVHGENIQC